MSGFDAYRKRQPGRHGACRACGASTAGRVGLALGERKVRSDRTTKDANQVYWPNIDATSGSYCEAHAIELYELLKATRDKFDADGSS